MGPWPIPRDSRALQRAGRLLVLIAAGPVVAVAAAGCASVPPDVTVPQSGVPSTDAGPLPDAAAVFAEGPLALAMAHSLRWTPWRGTVLPSSDRWGPRRVVDEAATGFDHSPEGALVATIQQQARLAAAADGSWPTVARREAVMAPGDTAPTVRVSTGFDTGADLPRFAGFRWVSGTPQRAVLDLALEDSDGRLTTVRATEVWTGSDWKAELPAAGSPPAGPLGGLNDGFQPWPGLP